MVMNYQASTYIIYEVFVMNHWCHCVCLPDYVTYILLNYVGDTFMHCLFVVALLHRVHFSWVLLDMSSICTLITGIQHSVPID